MRSRCLPFKSQNGLDELVCLSSDMHMGSSNSWIDVLSYRGHGLSEDLLVRTIGGNTAGGSPVGGYCYEQDVTAFEAMPDAAGFQIAVSQAKVVAFTQESSCEDSSRRLGVKETVRVAFRFNGDGFILDSLNKTNLKHVENFIPNQ